MYENNKDIISLVNVSDRATREVSLGAAVACQRVEEQVRRGLLVEPPLSFRHLRMWYEVVADADLK